MSQTTDNKPSTKRDEEEIRQLIAKWSHALEAKDLDGLVADYVPDAILFDAIPPYKTEGAENIRAAWESCLPYFPEKFQSEHRDVTIHVDGDIAFVHCLHHFVPTDPDHPSGQTWMRITACYRRVGGAWKTVHEHISIPFNPMNNQAFFITDPDVLDAPAYDEAPASSQN
jgi:uncharacterized protein (TIGR02246 family)